MIKFTQIDFIDFIDFIDYHIDSHFMDILIYWDINVMIGPQTLPSQGSPLLKTEKIIPSYTARVFSDGVFGHGQPHHVLDMVMSTPDKWYIYIWYIYIYMVYMVY